MIVQQLIQTLIGLDPTAGMLIMIMGMLFFQVLSLIVMLQNIEILLIYHPPKDIFIGIVQSHMKKGGVNN